MLHPKKNSYTKPMTQATTLTKLEQQQQTFILCLSRKMQKKETKHDWAKYLIVMFQINLRRDYSLLIQAGPTLVFVICFKVNGRTSHRETQVART